MVNWRADPSYVVEPAIKQVNDKMQFLEDKANRFLADTKTSLQQMAETVQLDDLNENLENIQIDSAGIGTNITIPQMPEQLPQLGTDNNLDAPQISYTPVPDPIPLPENNFQLEAPLVPNLGTLIPPTLVPPVPINLEHLPIPNAPNPVDLPMLENIGMDLVSAPAPIDVPRLPETIEAPNFAPEMNALDPELAQLPDLPSFSLPNTPIAPTANSLNFTEHNFEFGEIQPIPTGDFNFNEPALVTFNDVAKPTLNKSYEKPVRPNIQFDTMDVQAPDIIFDDLPVLREVDLPTFEFQPIAEFDKEAPDVVQVEQALGEFQEKIRFDSDQLLEKSKASFNTQFDEEGRVLKAQYNRLSDWVEGKDTPWSYIYRKIEDLLYAGVTDREHKTTERAVQQIRDEWSARGFSAPQGALDKRIDATREEGRMRIAEANRSIATDSFNKQLDEVRFLIEKGLQLEALLYQRFTDQRNYEFEIFKYRMESYWNIFNAVTNLFNAQNEAFKVYFEVYRLEVEHQFKEIEAFRAELDAKRSVIEINQQEIQVYQTKLQALNTRVEVYNSQLRAVAQKNDVFKSQIDLYRTELEGVSNEIDLDKLQVQMYQSEMDAEKTKFSVNEMLLQNHSMRIQAYAAKNDVLIKNQSTNIDVAKLRLDKYQAQISQEKARIDYQLAESQNATNHFMQTVEMYKIGVQNRMAEVDYSAKIADITSRTNISNIELTGRYVDINSRIALANVDAQSKVMETTSKIQLANLDAQSRHAELVTRVQTSNVDAEVKVREANSRIQSANADLMSKNADIKAKVALSNAEMQSKHQDMVSRTAMTNLEVQSRVAVSEAELAGRYAEINARGNISAAETQLKWSDLVTRYSIANLDTKFKQSELTTRVAMANQEMVTKNNEGNIRIATSQADLKSRFADMQARTQIANLDMRSKYIDLISRTNIAQIDSETRIAETNARLAMARADLLMKKYDFNMTKGLEKNKLAVEIAKSMGTINAQLAAGAMSAIHVSAGISASGSVGISSSTNESESESHNYSY